MMVINSKTQKQQNYIEMYNESPDKLYKEIFEENSHYNPFEHMDDTYLDNINHKKLDTLIARCLKAAGMTEISIEEHTEEIEHRIFYYDDDRGKWIPFELGPLDEIDQEIIDNFLAQHERYVQ